MNPGDMLVIYETANVKSAVGTATVMTVESSDTKEPRVRIRAGKPLSKPLPLSEIKTSKLFADSPLVRQGRLSVVPLTQAQYRHITGR
jgi:predicted RNA-binding protein with PUA-like domain